MGTCGVTRAAFSLIDPLRTPAQNRPGRGLSGLKRMVPLAAGVVIAKFVEPGRSRSECRERPT